jgi:ADP-ribose pyrophosphatase YjhB (NUDIX family)
MIHNHPLTPAEYASIYAKVPRLTVEIILRNQQGKLLLAKRAIEPCKGQWHLPGGTVRFGEPLTQAVNRIASQEIGITVSASNMTGIIEYPSHYLHGLDDPVGIAYEITDYTGTMTMDTQSSDYGWFDRCPEGIHADQDTFLITRGYL